MKNEKAYFAMGCFWKPQYLFSKIKGVLKTEVGYMNGKTKDPTYDEVCSDDTGHAETLKIEFDPKTVSYKELLDVFWNNHDPTTMNRQGPDVGDQYRSALFFTDDNQKKEAEASKKDAQKKHKEKIVTIVEKAKTFYPAEQYHQNYLEKRGLESCPI